MSESEIPDLPTAITPQSEDFGRWYIDVVRKAELADYSPVKGCMVIRPYGYAIWELMQQALDKDPNNTRSQQAYVSLGTAYWTMEQKGKAKKAYETYLKLFPTGSRADEIKSLVESLKDEK